MGDRRKGVADRHNYRKADNNNDRESNAHEACLHQNSGETVGSFINHNSHNNHRGGDHEYNYNKPGALWKRGCEPLDLVNLTTLKTENCQHSDKLHRLVFVSFVN